jgi:hypothetical protein
MDEHIKSKVIYDTFAMLYKTGPPTKRDYFHEKEVNKYKKQKISSIKEKKEEILKLIQIKDKHMIERKGGYDLI